MGREGKGTEFRDIQVDCDESRQHILYGESTSVVSSHVPGKP